MKRNGFRLGRVFFTVKVDSIRRLLFSLLTGGMGLAVSGNVVALELEALFDANRVIEIDITLPESDWDTIRKHSRDFRGALSGERRKAPPKSPYSYVEASVSIDGVRYPKVGVRKKGFLGSQSTSRPSLKLKLNEVDKHASIGGLTVLTLNNNRQDPSLLSQILGYKVCRDAQLPAPRCAYARVTVNGRNLGVYSHVEGIKVPLLTRGFGAADGTLYEGTIVDFHRGWEQAFELKQGNDEKGRQLIRELTALINDDAAVRNSDFEERIGRYVHLPDFYRFWALEGLLGAWDGYSGNSNNYFFYLSPETERIHFIPWGADALFVEKGKFDNDPRTPRSVKTTGLIANRLYQTAFGKKGYRKALEALLKEHWNEKELLAETHRLNQLTEDFLHPEQGRVSRASDAIRRFIETRRSRIEAEIADGMPDWNQPPRPPITMDNLDFGGGKKKWKSGEKDLMVAAKEGDVEPIEALVAKGVSLEIQDGMGRTPLSIAVIHGHGRLVKRLIEMGADPNGRGPDGSAPIHGAVFFGVESSVKALIEGGAKINAKNRMGQTAMDVLSLPWSEEQEEIIRFIGSMLQIDIDADAVRSSRSRLVAYVRSEGGLPAREVESSSRGSLGEAVVRRDRDQLKRLIADGADLNERDEKGIVPLCWAAMNGDPETVQWLIDQGAKVDGTNGDGATSLHASAFFGHVEVVQVLLANGANREARNLIGQTAIQGASAPWGGPIRGLAQGISSALELDIDLEKMRQGRPEAVKLLKND